MPQSRTPWAWVAIAMVGCHPKTQTEEVSFGTNAVEGAIHLAAPSGGADARSVSGVASVTGPSADATCSAGLGGTVPASASDGTRDGALGVVCHGVDPVGEDWTLALHADVPDPRYLLGGESRDTAVLFTNTPRYEGCDEAAAAQAHVVVVEAHGSAGAPPQGVTPDFSRTLRITFDGDAPPQAPGCARDDYPGHAALDVHATLLAKDYTAAPSTDVPDDPLGL
jgi:hypothetical protein